MPWNRRQFLHGAAAVCLGAPLLRSAESPAPPKPRIIYYNNFASHLLCAYNPNMYYPELPFRWSDTDWRQLVDMIASFGFTVFEYLLHDDPEAQSAIAV